MYACIPEIGGGIFEGCAGEVVSYSILKTRPADSRINFRQRQSQQG